MKKLSLFVTLLMLFQLTSIYAAGPVDSKTFSITLVAGTRSFSEDRFDEVYDDTPVTFGIDLAYKAFSTMEVFLHTDYLSVDGETTYTKEDTTLKIIPIELGLRYLLSMKISKNQRIYPYIGAGAGYYNVKEESDAIEDVSENRIGFFIEGGLRFYVASSIFIDAKVKNTFVKSENDTEMGGFSILGGVGFSF